MKLTKHIKESILNSILSGIPPAIDYIAQAQKLVWDDSQKQLPKELQDAISKNPDVKNFLSVESIRTNNFYCLGLRSFTHYVIGDGISKALMKLHSLHEQQKNKKREIRNNLWAIIDGCNTSKQISENYPEFAGYLPKEEQPNRTLPAVNLIKEMQEMGWKNK